MKRKLLTRKAKDRFITECLLLFGPGPLTRPRITFKGKIYVQGANTWDFSAWLISILNAGYVPGKGGVDDRMRYLMSRLSDHYFEEHGK